MAKMTFKGLAMNYSPAKISLYSMFCVAEKDICIVKHGLDWSNLPRNLVMCQCSSNNNETFKGTETCGHSMIRWSPED